jgi:hypothetical protein
MPNDRDPDEPARPDEPASRGEALGPGDPADMADPPDPVARPAEPNEPLEAVDEDEPIPGSPRSRVALVFGLAVLLAIVVFIAWFILTYNERPRQGGVLG